MVLAAAFAAIVGLWAGPPPVALAPYLALWLVGLPEELTDLLDGLVARRTGTASQLGGIFDPLSDSLSRLTIYFAMALAGWVSIAVPLVMAGRDIVVAYTRIANALTGGRTAARISGKIKAIVQSAGIPAVATLALWPASPAIEAGRWAAGGCVIAVTLWSLVDYLRGSLPAIRQLRRSA